MGIILRLLLLAYTAVVSASVSLDIRDSFYSPKSVCRRWSHASALFDGVVYIYGGQVWVNSSQAGNTTNTVTRDFITLDLSQDFNVDNPPFGPLPVPPVPGPAKVANGTFWVDDDEATLYFYGGAYENFPPDPDVGPNEIWAYHPKTSTWNIVETGGDNITRATQGAAAVHNGVGYYRGGHLDQYTVEDWGNTTARVYLGGMFEFTFANKSFTNFTTGFDVFGQSIAAGYQDADLIPIELKGKSYLIDIAGGGRTGTALPLTNAYIYDIAAQKWYQQPIFGDAPTNTRGACTTTNYAPDNSSVNIHVYGGKVWDGSANVFVPSDNMWILTIPSFTWIPIPLDGAVGSPGARQDHSCHIMGSNMLVVGGRNGSAVCDNSTVYVFDTSDLTWQTSYVANKTGYTVPTKISAIIGGTANGSAPWTDVPKVKPSDNTSPILYLNGHKSSSSKGAIIGGVVGGVIGLALIGALIFFLMRRRRAAAPIPPAGEQDEYYTPHGPVDKKTAWHNTQGEMPPSPPLSEAPRYSSLHPNGMSSPISQLDSGDYAFPVEMSSNHNSENFSNPAFRNTVVELSGDSPDAIQTKK